jgi:hypothetical protein
LGYAIGAFALSQEAWPALAALLPATFSKHGGARRYLIDPVRESIGHELAAIVMKRFSETKWLIPRWEHLKWSLSQSAVLKERWPEFLDGPETKFTALPNFDFLVSIYFGLQGRSVVAHWSMYYGGAEQMARRIRDDDRYRGSIANLLGADPEELPAEAAAALKDVRVPDFPNSDAIAVLVGQA